MEEGQKERERVPILSKEELKNRVVGRKKIDSRLLWVILRVGGEK